MDLTSETTALLDSSVDRSISISSQKKAKRSLITAMIVSTSFFVIELIAAGYSGSLALLSDSFHLLTDVLSFGISLYAIYLSQRPASPTHTWGYARAEVLGALLSTVLIWFLVLLLIWEAISRLQRAVVIDAEIMLYTSGFGVIVNFILATVLHHHPHDPVLSSEERSDFPIQDEPRHRNMALTSASLHVLGDLIFSLGVFIAAGVMWIHPEWQFLDPICTLLFSAVVLVTTLSFVWKSLNILMEGIPNDPTHRLGIPPHVDREALMQDLLSIQGVLEIHDLHIWALTPEKVTCQSMLIN
jgi:zinc transporter 2